VQNRRVNQDATTPSAEAMQDATRHGIRLDLRRSQARRDAALAIGLSFVAGYVDTVGFVALFGLFTAHVTGNFVLIGSELAHASGDVVLKLLAFPAFILAVAFTRMLVLWLERRGRVALRALLLLQAVLLAVFMAFGWAASPVHGTDAPLAMLAGVTAAAAMGVQNATGRLVLATLVPTTVMTGNVTQLVIDVVDLLRGAADDTVRQRSRKFVAPVVAFALGAIGGAFGYVEGGFTAVLLPIAVLLALAFSWQDAQKEQPA
jgi:uncharacterized membrane protein YoaK (UPF0700 family)